MFDTHLLNKIESISKEKEGTIDTNIAKYILANINNISTLTASKIAKCCYTSKSTVIRFCNKLGLHGFVDLKYSLDIIFKYYDLNIKNLQIFKEDRQNIDDKLSWITKYHAIKCHTSKFIVDNIASNLHSINVLINNLHLNQEVFIFAMNLAYNVTKNFVHRLRWLNKIVVLENDLNSVKSYIEILNKNSTVILISLSGESEFIKKISYEIRGRCYSFGILGKSGDISVNVNNYFLLPHIESQLWDIYSIRSQGLMQFLDFLYYNLIVSKK